MTEEMTCKAMFNPEIFEQTAESVRAPVLSSEKNNF